jgi:hypothetical protein
MGVWKMHQVMRDLVIQWKRIYIIDHMISSFSRYSVMNGILVLYLNISHGTVAAQMIMGLATMVYNAGKM